MDYQLIETASEMDFVKVSADLLKIEIDKAIKQKGICAIGLSGGSTPKAIYETLGKNKDIRWSEIYIFLTDERYTDPNSEDSNQKMIRDTLLKEADIPENNLIFPDTNLPIGKCIEKYEQNLTFLFNKNCPDLITLGLGEDGHIASLFPLLKKDQLNNSRLVINTTTGKFKVYDRISLSLSALKLSKKACFFLKGAAKKQVWDKMIGSKEGVKRWPGKAIIKKMDTIVFFNQN